MTKATAAQLAIVAAYFSLNAVRAMTGEECGLGDALNAYSKTSVEKQDQGGDRVNYAAGFPIPQNPLSRAILRGAESVALNALLEKFGDEIIELSIMAAEALKIGTAGRRLKTAA